MYKARIQNPNVGSAGEATEKAEWIEENAQQRTDALAVENRIAIKTLLEMREKKASRDCTIPASSLPVVGEKEGSNES